MDLTHLPKIELHLHLDCSLSYDLVRRLAPGVSRADFERDFIAPPKCPDLAGYLRTPARHVALLQSADALRLAVGDLFEQLDRDGVIYAEIRFAPLLHTAAGLAPEQIVRAVEAATAAAAAETGIEAGIILCALRHFSAAQSLETAQLVHRFRGSRVVALDLAGDEAGYGLDAHQPAFDYAAEQGLACTAHAGEARGPSSVSETLQRLRPARIGHGVRSIEDPALVAHLAETGVHLEVCPSCNVQTGIYPAYADHPVDRLLRQGVSLGINTDARTVTNVTLAQEYARLAEAFGWGPQEFLTANLNAARAAFAAPNVRHRLEERLAGWAIQD